MRPVIQWCAAIGLLVVTAPLAQAQGTYPDRPIRFVVAFPPGGATDTFFRQISNELGTALGQTIVIENKGGAGGYVGWQYVSSAAPDGYTVLVAENALGINQALFKKHPSGFDPLRDYDAVAAMGSTPLVFTIANNVPANSFGEFVAWSKTVKDKFNYGSAGPGSVAHLSAEVIIDGAGSQSVHVPYKGGGPAAAAVAGGHVAMVVSALPVAKAQAEGKLIKALAVTSDKRSLSMPDVPTLRSDLGVKTADVALEFWWGLFTPKGTPPAINARLQKAVQDTMSNPAVRERLQRVDTDPSFAPGPALRVKLENEIKNWSAFIDAKGIKVEQ
ncbi:MAG: tripartite tricarboxylate transporter substrate-binding protein [Alphaproteobacteria bacterium]|nr:tripartite tricarboxylate transporter substrate-binding protein [Alphaproteobacteria bacterium]